MRTVPILAACSLLLLATPAAAQCPWSSVSVTSYGQGCSAPFPNQQVGVAATLDVTTCQLGLDVVAFGGCCNTFLVGRALVVGLSQTATPVPQLGAGCTLLASPDLLLFEPSAPNPQPFVLQLPNAPLPPTTLYAQGVAVYFTTIGLTVDVTLGPGARIDLQ
ncbi:MAG: hypothetical protein KAI24_16350 [Planctomycetes bacterium]|nr:hypothetical protein [Planctomycetota bacterium]